MRSFTTTPFSAAIIDADSNLKQTGATSLSPEKGNAVNDHPPIAELIAQGIARQQQGLLDEAQQIYRDALRIAPDNADAMHLLGTIAYQQGKYESALDQISKALACKPTGAMYGNLGLIYQALDNPDAAVACFREALALDPEDAFTYNNLGIVMRSRGKLAAAVESFLKALAIRPAYAAAYCNLGATLHDQGHLHQAIECYETAVTIDPQYAMAYNNLGNAYRELGQCQSAIDCLMKSIALNPHYAMAYNNLGNALKDGGDPVAAIGHYRKALELEPELAEVHSNFLLTMHTVQGYTAPELYSEHLRFAQQFEAPLKQFWRAHDNKRDKNKRLKIGYVSGDFRDHPVGHFLESVLHNHDADQVEMYCYYNYHQQDETSKRFANRCDHWILVKGLSDAELAERIRLDGIDILIDLSGHTAHNRLLTFARKPAPIQLTWIGYQATTGLTAIDYRLSDFSMDPIGMTEQFHSEILLRMDICAPFKPAPQSPAVNELPALRNGYFTFACLNQLTKISEKNFQLWARILEALPNARMMLGNINDATMNKKIVASFSKFGIEENRLILHRRMPLVDYLSLHHHIDLTLDSFPYNGGTTSCHSLVMGVPVLTLTGDLSVSRAGKAILDGVGLPDFVTHSADDYFRRAVEITQDLPKLNAIRQSLRGRIDAPHNNKNASPADSVEKMFRSIWTKWCES